MGGVRVKTENSLSKYNAISPYFTYYAMDIAQNDILDQQENVVANRVYSKKKPDAPYVVRYPFPLRRKIGIFGYGGILPRVSLQHRLADRKGIQKAARDWSDFIGP